MQTQYGIDPLGSNPRMEEVFNYIYSDAFAINPPSNCLDAYWALLRMYAESIATTTNDLSGTSHYGIGAVTRAIWNTHPGDTITFVTFNQDLLIEKALDATKRTKTYAALPWDIRQAYSMQFGSWASYGAGQQTFVQGSDPSIRVLKLHGSLNWVYKVRSGSDPRNSLRSPSGELVAIAEKRVLTSLRYKPGKRWVDVIPLVVPPIYEKVSRYGEAVAPLWQEAVDAISAAECVVVFGYSFPDADFGARAMFHRAFYANSKLQELHVIDVDPAVAANASRLFEVGCMHYYCDVPSFSRKVAAGILS